MREYTPVAVGKFQREKNDGENYAHLIRTTPGGAMPLKTVSLR